MLRSPEHIQVCNRCIMDTTDPQIFFDAQGICNHCYEFDRTTEAWNLPRLLRDHALERKFEQIRKVGAGKDFDCIMGLSGGVDSSYVAWLAKEHGLRPLCVHLDNGWNSELAVANIHGIVKTCGFELFTHVIDWEEFKDLQRSFFRADVIDLELLTDHAIFGVIIQLAKKFKIKSILSGSNIATEAVLPKSWVHRKQDLANIRAIHKAYGTRSLRSFPQVSTLHHVFLMYGLGYRVVRPLNMIDYNKSAAKSLLTEKFGWRDYGGKHYESIFTKFYQAHILPEKFGVDKRKAHLSTLILSGQMSRESALKELEMPLYDPQELAADTAYVCKKLGFSTAEFQDYMERKPRGHYEFKTDQTTHDFLAWGQRTLKSLRG